jgi:hypothetical protein
MNTNEIRELLPDYVCGLLDEEKTAKIEELVQTSEPLRKECEELHLYFNSIKTLKPIKAPGNFLNSIQNRIAVASPFTKIVHKLFHPLQVKIPLELAGLVATVVIVVLLFNPFELKNIAPPEFEDKSEIEEEKHDVQPVAVKKADQSQEDKLAMNESAKAVEKREEKEIVSPIKTVRERKVKTAEEPKKVTSKIALAKRSETVDKDDSYATPPSIKPTKKIGKSRGLFKAEEALAGGGVKAVPESEEALSDDELFAKAIIDRSDSIVKRKIYPEPEAVDVGLLALSIQSKGGMPAEGYMYESAAPEMQVSRDKKAETMKLSIKERKVTSRRKKSKQAPAEAASAAQEAPPKPESQSELVFAQIESKIKSKNGKVTLLKDKPQTEKKKYYVVEIPSKFFTSLKEELELEGTLIDKNFYYDSLHLDFIQFNLIVDIK